MEAYTIAHELLRYRYRFAFVVHAYNHVFQYWPLYSSGLYTERIFATWQKYAESGVNSF